MRRVEMRRLRAAPDLAPEVDPSGGGPEALRAEIRVVGHASVVGRFIPGLVAIAAPILDWQGEASAAVTLIGTGPSAVDPEGGSVTHLSAFCEDPSVRLREGAEA